MAYTSVQKYEVQYIVDLINANPSKTLLNGKMILVSGPRLKNFAQNGTDCICCGAKGSYFSLESNGGGLHLNLYALNKYGHPVLMTRDHIVLRSKGGPDVVENYSPMCVKCNNMRGSQYENLPEFLMDYANGRVRSVPRVNQTPENSKSRRQKIRELSNWRYRSCFYHVPLYYQNLSETV